MLISDRECYTCLFVDMFGYLIGGVLFFSPPLKKFFCASDCVTVMSFDNRIWWRL